jgi:hypothetical protein
MKKKFAKKLLKLIYKNRKLGPDYIQGALLMEAVFCSGHDDMSQNVRETLRSMVNVSRQLGIQLQFAEGKPTVH